ncbi:MAG: DUF4160 domain-containing protein [Candidatus Paraimprobicoccus trichonymphae]|uniref:DUF4160 domain-containing protein n=1 Tax=Candidatus Paraimprobicoccus trichonymphae TaxID=3033793 RepID=A0AA48I4G1_9FIRM|nr:MAG: DUF4160 domain-containing protein [Candidatus Paraimprobicoccus trichonymphae]
MSVLSMFYGIIISIFTKNEHNPPHIHAEYGEYEMSVTFEGEILAGNLPRKQRRLVKAWIEIHKEELEADWKLAMKKLPIFKIKPLD